MNLNEKIEAIEKLDYWDSEVVHFSSDYFGDEAILIYDDGNNNNIMYQFLACQNINIHHSYKIDKPYKRLSLNQLSMFLQNVEISEKDNFYLFKINAHPLYLEICCKDIEISKVKKEECAIMNNKRD